MEFLLSFCQNVTEIVMSVGRPGFKVIDPEQVLNDLAARCGISKEEIRKQLAAIRAKVGENETEHLTFDETIDPAGIAEERRQHLAACDFCKEFVILMNG